MSARIWLPKNYTWRELWESRNIVGAKIPSSLAGGLPMTIAAGATKGMTCDGIHFDGTVNSYMDCGEIHDAATKFVISLRFKFDFTYTVGKGDMYLFQKRLSGDNKLTATFATATGKLSFENKSGGVVKYGLPAQIGGVDVTSWTGGVWYHVLFSASSANGGRLRCNGDTAVTTADTTGIPNGGNLVIGNSSAYGVSGVANCTITDVQVREGVDLTSDQEYQAYLGLPFTPDEHYPCVTGYSTTVYSRGTAANNATISTGNYWVKGTRSLPIKANGYNCTCNSAATGDASGDISLVWVGRLKEMYGDALQPASQLFGAFDGTNYLGFQGAGGSHKLIVADNGSSVAYTGTVVMDSYTILVLTKTAGGALYFWVDGQYIGTGASTFSMPNTGMTWYLGNYPGPLQVDPSQCIAAGVVNGRLTNSDVQKLTRVIKSHFGI